MTALQSPRAGGRLRLAPLAALLAAVLAVAAAVGAWPTWRFYGRQGLLAAGAAAAINAAVLGASAWAVSLAFARGGAAAAGRAFVLAGIARMAAVICCGALAVNAAGLVKMVFWLWAAGLYVVMLIAEAAWIGRRLARSAGGDGARNDVDAGQR